MASKKIKETVRKELNRGAWTGEEDRKLAETIEVYGPKRWKTIAAKSGLNRCWKSCRLRWMNYLRPNIKRGNISDQEEDLILRLHRLLGNRWSLIAGRLPGRTDNEIKNYWNSHLSKKVKEKEEKQTESSRRELGCEIKKVRGELKGKDSTNGIEGSKVNSDLEDSLFDFSNESPLDLEWVSKFLELDESFCHLA